MLTRLILALALALGLAHGPAMAASVSQQPNTRVELLAESTAPRAGDTFTVALAMTARPGWHTYWKNPGDSGIETRATWDLPAGFAAGPFRYPVPKTFVVEGIMNHVFEGESILLADVAVPQDASGAFLLKARFDWLVCDDSICVPESATLELPLQVGDGAPDARVAARFAAARAALPIPLAEPARFTAEGARIRIAVPMGATEGVTAAHFFADDETMVRAASVQQVMRTPQALVIETDLPATGAPALLSGVLRVERGNAVTGFQISGAPGPVPPAGEPLAPAGEPRAGPGFGAAFGLALIGGLLLNLMPCVFPILSLKAMSLAKSGTSALAARAEGLAYTAGVVLSCVALGAVAIALARAGQGAGWAFQLQDPRVILFLLLLVLAIGLNFAGLFEVNLGSVNAGQGLAAQPGSRGAFFTGVLAAFVATPCTGPFMAGALGAALVLPTAAGLAVFAGLGLGLALPFLAVGFVPALRRLLPRPGPWMQTFRRVLAVPMLLTAVALAWVLGRQAGVNALSFGLLAALLLALGLWWIGLRQARMARVAGPVVLALAATIGAPALLPRLAADGAAQAATAAAPAALKGVSFSPAALARLQADGTPTFLYFTADWCITCKVNERGALSSAKVAEAFEQAGITVMVGDWTRPDPDIARFLESRGRAGIPLYLYFGPDGSVRELPQLLTVDMLTGLASDRSA
ncbi:MAG: protein-disulfide reductase DsbD domain-containing protein [Sphingomonadaceae bacterium]